MKIRGHKRRWRKIESSIKSNLTLDMDAVKRYKRGQFAYYVFPWGGSTISMNPGKFKQPRGKTKAKMILGFINIYNSWKAQLESLNEPYYLKIWICEPNFSNSRVVYGLGNCIEGFERDILIDEEKLHEWTNYGNEVRAELSKFDWATHVDEEIVEIDSEIIKLKTDKNRTFRKGEYVDEDGEVKELLYFGKGLVYKGFNQKKL
ncbi:MAG: hypothetical protein H6584_04810 [Flavobacteriales bacterium]|nr:hypothetical protein [Flavobacteriales bacterium]